MAAHEISAASISRPSPRRLLPAWLIQLLRPASKAHLKRMIIGMSMVMLMLILVLPTIFILPVVKDGRALRTVYADKPMQVEDVEQTAYRRDFAAKSVNSVYREIPGASLLVEDRVVNLLESLRDVALDSELSAMQKNQKFRALLPNVSSEDWPKVSEGLSEIRNWHLISQATQSTLAAVLRKGVSAEDLQAHRDSFVKAYLSHDLDKNPVMASVVKGIITEKLRPTLTIDEKLTENARQQAIESVEPVIEAYFKGDLVVRKGEVITRLQTEVLRRQGLLMNENRLLHVLGICLLVVSFMVTIWGYISHFERKTFFKPSYISLFSTLLVITIGGMVFWNNLFPNYLFVYPVPILAFMITIFSSARVAIYVSLMSILLASLALQIPLETMATLSLSCLAGIVTLLRCPIPKDRFDILNAGFVVGLVQSAMFIIISLIYEPTSNINIPNLAFNLILTTSSGMLSGIITLGALPLLESWFKLITPFTLLELSKLDSSVLKRMQIEAPGTFHHSLIISTLAEAAAEAIGCNGLLARVGALYHDIGKIKRPLFFVENQAYFGSENPHDKLSCRLSKMIVISHPRDGVEMGRKLGLPEQILAFMPEHHGTMIAGYFYNKAVLEEGEENVDKEQYRYPGPKPQTKETAIVMLADACESATRALRSPSQVQLEERIDKIIKQRIDDHQFSEAPITLREIELVRDTFVRVLRGMQHNRIEYQQAVIKDFTRQSAVVPVSSAQPMQSDPGAETGRTSEGQSS